MCCTATKQQLTDFLQVSLKDRIVGEFLLGTKNTKTIETPQGLNDCKGHMDKVTVAMSKHDTRHKVNRRIPQLLYIQCV